MPADPNLFDGRLSVFFNQPNEVAEVSLAQFAGNLRAAAPNINAVIVKTNTGAGWEGKSNPSKPNLSIRGLPDLLRWVDELGARGLECHAWCAVRGFLVQRELDRLAQVCQHGGVRSLLLRLEPGFGGAAPGAWIGDEPAAQALAAGLRERVGPAFHLGVMFDPRPGGPSAVFVQSAWFPEIDSLHPLVFHRQYGLTARQALQGAYETLLPWGKPIYPVLQAFATPTLEVAEAVALAAGVHHAPGLSLFRYGLGAGRGLNRDELGQVAAHWPAGESAGAPAAPPAASASRPMALHSFAAGASAPVRAPALVMLDPDDERNGPFTIGYYGGGAQLSQGWTADRDSNGRARLYRSASYKKQTLYVGYAPKLAAKGAYAIDVFVPRTHATIRDAHYFIVDYPRGVRRETLAILDQSPHRDAWVTLSGTVVNGSPAEQPVTEFMLDPQFADAGRVNVADLTFVDPAGMPNGRFDLSVGAVRWRPLAPPGETPPAAAPGAGFDSPVGADAERAGVFATGDKIFDHYNLWCGNWYDANPIGTRYQLGDRWAVHTGADLNLSGPGGVLADKDAPVHAAADGRVISAGFVSSGWKNIIVIEHPVPGEDRVVYARYAHVADMHVHANDPVARGQVIAAVGEYAPNNYHLHFDLSFNPILKTQPGHWPGDNLALVQQVYLDPLAFIRHHHMVR